MGFPYEAKILRESGCTSIIPDYQFPQTCRDAFLLFHFFHPMGGDAKSNALFSCPAQMKLR
jgi:hypothetical protein